MKQQIDRSKTIPGTMIFDGLRSHKGYRINKLAFSMNIAENRDSYVADPEAYMDRYNLTEEEKKPLREKDWLGVVKAGGNIYMIMKIGVLLGEGLYPMGAQQKGMTYDEFLKSRNVGGAT
ncbi:MAG: protocatechuate 3,4-dioxygenase [Rhodospirillales bacterium]|jgi:protocatechuate 4,5-dioxygenase alpha subunit